MAPYLRGVPMKKVLIALLVVIFGGLALAGGGLYALSVCGKRWDSESKAYVEAAVPAVLRSWSAAELDRRAAEEFRAAGSPAELEAFLKKMSDQLGPLKRYDGASGESRFSFNGGPRTVTAAYLSRVSFEKGDADVETILVRRRDQWLILAFRISPVEADAPRYQILGARRGEWEGRPAVLLGFRTLTNLDDKDAVGKEADEIWGRVKDDVEGAGVDTAVMSAMAVVHGGSGLFISRPPSRRLVYRKDARGLWARAD